MNYIISIATHDVCKDSARRLPQLNMLKNKDKHPCLRAGVTATVVIVQSKVWWGEHSCRSQSSRPQDGNGKPEAKKSSDGIAEKSEHREPEQQGALGR